MTNTENLFELVYILLEKKHVTAAVLASHFEVSVRTIYRWIDSLCIAGVPVYTTKGNGGGIEIDRDYALDKTILTEDEKLEILAALNAMKNLTFSNDGNAAENSAERKLKALSNKSADWLEVDFSTWNPLGSYIRTVFEVLKKAILYRKIVTFNYFSSHGENSFRTVHPWKIIFKSQAWYLYGWCEKKKEPRYFKLSRIQDINETVRRISVFLENIPESERKREYYDKREMDVKNIRLVIQVAAASVYRILDEFKIEKEERQKDGSSILTLELPDMFWLDSWILSFGTNIKVIKPVKVKNRIRKTVEKMQQGIFENK